MDDFSQKSAIYSRPEIAGDAISDHCVKGIGRYIGVTVEPPSLSTFPENKINLSCEGGEQRS